MILEGDNSVIDAIKEKKRLMDAGESHDHIKPLLIIGGGMMKGVYGVGAVRAMDELGYNNVFHTAAGVSAGAPTVAYLLGENTRTGGRVIYEDGCSKIFFNIWRWSNPLNSKFFQEVVEGKTGKPIDADRVISHPTTYYIGVSRFADGTPEVINPKNPEELFTGIRASVSMPGAVTANIEVSGVRYIDGSSTNPHITEYIWNQAKDATHVLIITNQDKSTKKIGLPERLLLYILYYPRLSKKLRYAATHRRRIRHAFIEEKLSSQEKPLLVSWGDEFLGSFEQNPQKVEAGVDRSEAWWRQLLS